MTLSDSISSTDFSYAGEALKFGECFRARAGLSYSTDGAADPIRGLTKAGVRYVEKGSSSPLTHSSGPPVAVLAASAVDERLRSFDLMLDPATSSALGLRDSSSYSRLQDYGAGQIAVSARLAGFEEVFAAVERWSALNDGWDEEDSPAPLNSSIGRASKLLFEVARHGVEAPKPYIAGDGEFGFQWRAGKRFASASFLPSGDVLLFVTDGASPSPYRKRVASVDAPPWPEFLSKIVANA